MLLTKCNLLRNTGFIRQNLMQKILHGFPDDGKDL
jgi:hypothetical protein